MLSNLFLLTKTLSKKFSQCCLLCTKHTNIIFILCLKKMLRAQDDNKWLYYYSLAIDHYAHCTVASSYYFRICKVVFFVVI